MTIPKATDARIGGTPGLLPPDMSAVTVAATCTIVRSGPHTRAAVAGLVVATLAIGAAYASALAAGAGSAAPAWAPWLMAMGVPAWTATLAGHPMGHPVSGPEQVSGIY